MSDTPETDAFMAKLHPTMRYPIYEAELRRLERERNELLAACREVEAALPGHSEATGLSRLLSKF